MNCVGLLNITGLRICKQQHTPWVQGIYSAVGYIFFFLINILMWGQFESSRWALKTVWSVSGCENHLLLQLLGMCCSNYQRRFHKWDEINCYSVSCTEIKITYAKIFFVFLEMCYFIKLFNERFFLSFSGLLFYPLGLHFHAQIFTSGLLSLFLFTAQGSPLAELQRHSAIMVEFPSNYLMWGFTGNPDVQLFNLT